MTKVFKVTLMVIDHDDVGETGVRSLLENARYANLVLRQPMLRAISPQVADVEARTVEWDDALPINHRGRWLAAFRALFAKKS